ncbi:MAG TPA: alkaline phosphatase family protein [Candidatus Acidoferrales bacterium]|jgi:phospholipase C|nr:alkaline phosphatase family protein [Candidatus Acidoferrales bacterium]
MASHIEHLFVLMLENRSFDHMLGFSGITGTDAVTGAPTKINGLNGSESNIFSGQTISVSPGAPDRMPADPGHEFSNVVLQLCGSGVSYPRGGPYPAIFNSGFVASYVASGGGSSPGVVMNCYSPTQLPVLHALAAEFVVCDNWHASMPGPTWPNRMFVHAASSNGLDHSPSIAEIAEWEALAGFSFPNGTIFDALDKRGIKHRLYGGDDFPMVSALKGIHLDDIRDYSQLADDLHQSSYPFGYVFIEPSYDVANDYKNGTSQHPLADVNRGEALIKATYEAIRNSAFWESSLLIITWDEHGGFYDHATPPDAVAPSSTDVNSSHNQNGFTFEKYGPRVPALVVSPWIARNLIDHRVYDHASIPATLEALFGLSPLTKRDAAANRLNPLLALPTPRNDAPTVLPPVASVEAASLEASMAQSVPSTASVSRPDDSADDGNLPGIVQGALRQDLDVSPPAERSNIIARVASIKKRSEAIQYLNEVRLKVGPFRAVSP